MAELVVFVAGGISIKSNQERLFVCTQSGGIL